MVHVPLMFLSECLELPSAPCFAGKKNLMTARFSILLKSRASPDMLHFSLCNKERPAIRHMNRPPFPKTLSIQSYDIGKEVGLRTYQHHLCMCVCVYIYNLYVCYYSPSSSHGISFLKNNTISEMWILINSHILKGKNLLLLVITRRNYFINLSS